MAKYHSPRFRNFLRLRSVKLAGLVILVAAILAVLELTNTTHLFHKPPASKVVVAAGTPVTPPKSDKSVSSTNQPPTGGGAARDGGATDTGGSSKASSNSSQWTTSASGLITVKQPVANSLFQSGDTLVGSAKVAQVNYRLKDNKIGVIAQGLLKVVDGNFSGSLHFQSQGTGGQIDVFTTDSLGVEYNEVQINVRF